MTQPNHLGQYEHLIRVNGLRSVLGTGHSVREAEIHVFDLAAETWPHNAHIFQMLKNRGNKSLRAAS